MRDFCGFPEPLMTLIALLKIDFAHIRLRMRAMMLLVPVPNVPVQSVLVPSDYVPNVQVPNVHVTNAHVPNAHVLNVHAPYTGYSRSEITWFAKSHA